MAQAVAAVGSNSFGKRLCQLLGLKENEASSITISVVAGDVVRIETKTILLAETENGIFEVLKDYVLVEKTKQEKEC